MAFGQNIYQRKINKRNHIIDLIRREGVLSKAQAKVLSGYSMDTVISIFNLLIEEDLIVPSKGTQKPKGRNAVFYALNEKVIAYVGTTFNQSGIYSSVVSISHKIFKNFTTPLEGKVSKKDFVSALKKHYGHIQNDNNIPADSIESIGLSIPGDIETETGILHAYSFMPSLEETNFCEIIGSIFPEKKIIIEHNMKSMAAYFLNEYNLPVINKKILFISARSGPANILIHDGKIVVDRGEFGHIRVTENSLLCSCGRKGCLNCYFSAESFHEILTSMGHSHPGHETDLYLEALERLYSEGHREITEELDKRFNYFTSALIDSIFLTAPDHIILTGELLKIFGDPVKKFLETSSKCFQMEGVIPHIRNTKIEFLDLGTEIIAQGICYQMISEQWGYINETEKAYTPRGKDND